MTTCQNCGHHWNWRTLMIEMNRFRPAMNCPNCGASQFITRNSRKRSFFLGYLPALFLLLGSMMIDLQLVTIFAVAMVLFIAITFLMPFVVKLSNVKETMW